LARAAVLLRNGHVDVNLVKLDSKMSKIAAAQKALEHRPMRKAAAQFLASNGIMVGQRDANGRFVAGHFVCANRGADGKFC
jgi:hypothetical protein